MKKSEMLNRKIRKMIAKNLIVAVVLVAVAFAGVNSWFTTVTRANATNISVHAKVGEKLEQSAY